MQYFIDREQAGSVLVSRLDRYKDSLSVVVALSAGGVLVAKPIAEQLHLPLGLLVTEEVALPWNMGPVMGSVDSSGQYTNNPFMSESVHGAYEGEYHSYIDQERMRLTHVIHKMHTSRSIERGYLRDKTIILVDDGMPSAPHVQQAITYLKPVRAARIVAATPVSTVDAIDFLHIAVNEIHCLDVKNNYVTTDHYYENDEDLDQHKIVEILKKLDIPKQK